MLKAEITADGTPAVDGEKMVLASIKLLRELARLAQAVKTGLQECPRGSLPCIGLNEPTLEAFSEIFKSAAALQAALSEASQAADAASNGGDYGLASMEVRGRG